MSCNEDESIPSYVYISNITLTSNSGTEGSSSSNIIDAWVYHNGKEQGVYEMPITFPILAEGTTKLNVYAGVLKNGISGTRVSYPFYAPDTLIRELNVAKTDTITPSVRYVKNAIFDFIENFENGNRFSHLKRINDAEVFEGSSSAKMEFENDSSIVVSRTSTTYPIPSLSSAVYLELDYKSNHLFQVGITGFLGNEILSVVKLNLNPKDDWNKIYVDFTPEVNGLRADSYEIFFRVIPETQASLINLYLDNVKLIHFNVL